MLAPSHLKVGGHGPPGPPLPTPLIDLSDIELNAAMIISGVLSEYNGESEEKNPRH